VTRATAGLLLIFAACSGSATGGPGEKGDAATAARSAMVGTTWTVAPHREYYLCVRQTVTEDLYISRFAPIAPLGTHHTVLTIDETPEADGVTTCSSFSSAPHMIYGSGVGTEPYDLPPGVAMKVGAGQQLLLNLHLYNTGEEPLTGTSGVVMTTAARELVVHEAEVVLAGTIELVVPPGPSMRTGHCTMPGDVMVFGAGAHMHRLGVRQRITVDRTGDVLRDGPYSFDDQNLMPVEVALQKGDRVTVDCFYDNDTGHDVLWGESSDAEMCFGLLMRYPAQGRHHICLD
jgi:hypothetical protein